MHYKILALDGGGIRSIFSAQLLFRLHDEFKILHHFDMIAGTSGGAIVAAGLACGWSASQIVDFFAAEGPIIFERTVYPGIIDNFAYLSRSKYGENRRHAFEKYFGNRRLSDCQHHLVIPAFDVQHRSGIWQPVSFNNFPNSPLRDARFVDAVMASSAAPVYFPVHKAHFEDICSKWIDGGIWANNPSDCAFSEAVREDHGNADWRKVVVLSLGTTRGKKTLETAKNDLGVLDWYNAGIIDLIMDAAAKDSVDYRLRNYLGPRYHRMDLTLEAPIELDDIASIPKLIALANDFDLRPTEDWLQGFWI
jgi:uncharacterized protein